MQFFFQHQNAVDIGSVIKEANLLQHTTPPELHPEKLLDPFVPLSKGTYPVFNKYPKFIVDYQVQERQRIRLEELEYLRERWVVYISNGRRGVPLGEVDSACWEV